ncbi:MAG: hypothetical protein NTV23_10265 [Propionibacteriales bacterium]|nr:hypothetical protein [Propionibacteriales bacterium]
MNQAADLAAVLGEEPPASVRALPVETLARLTEQITVARKRQHAEMEASVATAIAGVPFAVRGIVKKALS